MDHISFGVDQFEPVRSAPAEINLLGPGQGMPVWILGVLITLRMLSKDTGGHFGTHEDIIATGTGPPPHYHTREDEYWYCLEGELTWTVDGKDYNATKGSYIHLPKNVVHGFVNKQKSPARLLVTYAPGGFEDWFLEVGVPAQEFPKHGSPPEMTEESVRLALKKASDRGVYFLPPMDAHQQADDSRAHGEL